MIYLFIAFICILLVFVIHMKAPRPFPIVLESIYYLLWGFGAIFGTYGFVTTIFKY